MRFRALCLVLARVFAVQSTATDITFNGEQLCGVPGRKEKVLYDDETISLKCEEQDLNLMYLYENFLIASTTTAKNLSFVFGLNSPGEEESQRLEIQESMGDSISNYTVSVQGIFARVVMQEIELDSMGSSYFATQWGTYDPIGLMVELDAEAASIVLQIPREFSLDYINDLKFIVSKADISGPEFTVTRVDKSTSTSTRRRLSNITTQAAITRKTPALEQSPQWMTTPRQLRANPAGIPGARRKLRNMTSRDHGRTLSNVARRRRGSALEGLPTGDKCEDNGDCLSNACGLGPDSQMVCCTSQDKFTPSSSWNLGWSTTPAYCHGLALPSHKCVHSQQCQHGWRCTGKICADCDEDFHATENDNECIACPANSVAKAGAPPGTQTFCTCKADFYTRLSSIGCIACPANSVADAGATPGTETNCKCKKDFYSTRNVTDGCIPCLPALSIAAGSIPGYAGTCDICKADFYTNLTSSDCIPCPANSVADAGATPGTLTNCICKENFYATDDVSKGCQKCDDNYVLESGSIPGNASTCVCKENFFATDNVTDGCQKCADNYVLESGSIPGNASTCVCKENFFATDNVTDGCQKCVNNYVLESGSIPGNASTCEHTIVKTLQEYIPTGWNDTNLLQEKMDIQTQNVRTWLTKLESTPVKAFALHPDTTGTDITLFPNGTNCSLPGNNSMVAPIAAHNIEDCVLFNRPMKRHSSAMPFEAGNFTKKAFELARFYLPSIINVSIVESSNGKASIIDEIIRSSSYKNRVLSFEIANLSLPEYVQLNGSIILKLDTTFGNAPDAVGHFTGNGSIHVNLSATLLEESFNIAFNMTNFEFGLTPYLYFLDDNSRCLDTIDVASDRVNGTLEGVKFEYLPRNDDHVSSGLYGPLTEAVRTVLEIPFVTDVGLRFLDSWLAPEKASEESWNPSTLSKYLRSYSSCESHGQNVKESDEGQVTQSDEENDTKSDEENDTKSDEENVKQFLQLVTPLIASWGQYLAKQAGMDLSLSGLDTLFSDEDSVAKVRVINEEYEVEISTNTGGMGVNLTFDKIDAYIYMTNITLTARVNGLLMDPSSLWCSLRNANVSSASVSVSFAEIRLNDVLADESEKRLLETLVRMAPLKHFLQQKFKDLYACQEEMEGTFPFRAELENIAPLVPKIVENNLPRQFRLFGSNITVNNPALCGISITIPEAKQSLEIFVEEIIVDMDVLYLTGPAILETIHVSMHVANVNSSMIAAFKTSMVANSALYPSWACWASAFEPVIQLNSVSMNGSITISSDKYNVTFSGKDMAYMISHLGSRRLYDDSSCENLMSQLDSPHHVYTVPDYPERVSLANLDSLALAVGVLQPLVFTQPMLQSGIKAARRIASQPWTNSAIRNVSMRNVNNLSFTNISVSLNKTDGRIHAYFHARPIDTSPIEVDLDATYEGENIQLHASISQFEVQAVLWLGLGADSWPNDPQHLLDNAQLDVFALTIQFSKLCLSDSCGNLTDFSKMLVTSALQTYFNLTMREKLDCYRTSLSDGVTSRRLLENVLEIPQAKSGTEKKQVRWAEFDQYQLLATLVSNVLPHYRSMLQTMLVTFPDKYGRASIIPMAANRTTFPFSLSTDLSGSVALEIPYDLAAFMSKGSLGLRGCTVLNVTSCNMKVLANDVNPTTWRVKSYIGLPDMAEIFLIRDRSTNTWLSRQNTTRNVSDILRGIRGNATITFLHALNFRVDAMLESTTVGSFTIDEVTWQNVSDAIHYLKLPIWDAPEDIVLQNKTGDEVIAYAAKVSSRQIFTREPLPAGQTITIKPCASDIYVVSGARARSMNGIYEMHGSKFCNEYFCVTGGVTWIMSERGTQKTVLTSRDREPKLTVREVKSNRVKTDADGHVAKLVIGDLEEFVKLDGYTYTAVEPTFPILTLTQAGTAICITAPVQLDVINAFDVALGGQAELALSLRLDGSFLNGTNTSPFFVEFDAKKLDLEVAALVEIFEDMYTLDYRQRNTPSCIKEQTGTHRMLKIAAQLEHMLVRQNISALLEPNLSISTSDFDQHMWNHFIVPKAMKYLSAKLNEDGAPDTGECPPIEYDLLNLDLATILSYAFISLSGIAILCVLLGFLATHKGLLHAPRVVSNPRALWRASEIPAGFGVAIPIAIVGIVCGFIAASLSVGGQLTGTIRVLQPFNVVDVYTRKLNQFALVETIFDMYNSNSLALAISIGLASGAFPFINCALMLFAWCLPPTSLSARFRARLINFSHHMGKFMMFNVFFLVVFVHLYRIRLSLIGVMQGVTDSSNSGAPNAIMDIYCRPEFGSYCFFAACMGSLVCSFTILIFNRRVEHVRLQSARGVISLSSASQFLKYTTMVQLATDEDTPDLLRPRAPQEMNKKFTLAKYHQQHALAQQQLLAEEEGFPTVAPVIIHPRENRCNANNKGAFSARIDVIKDTTLYHVRNVLTSKPVWNLRRTISPMSRCCRGLWLRYTELEHTLLPLLLVVSIVSTLCAYVMDTVGVQYGGLFGYLMRFESLDIYNSFPSTDGSYHTTTRTLSMHAIGVHEAESTVYDFSTISPSWQVYVVQGLVILLTIIGPLLTVAMGLFLWVVPTRATRWYTWSNAMEYIHSHSMLNVLAGTAVLQVLSVENLMMFMIGRNCDGIRPFLRDFFGDRFEDHCLTARPAFPAGVVVLPLRLFIGLFCVSRVTTLILSISRMVSATVKDPCGHSDNDADPEAELSTSPWETQISSKSKSSR